jgi:hypothetical protein
MHALHAALTKEQGGYYRDFGLPVTELRRNLPDLEKN